MSEPKPKKWQEFEFSDTLPAGQTAFFSGDQWKAFWPKSFELLSIVLTQKADEEAVKSWSIGTSIIIGRGKNDVALSFGITDALSLFLPSPKMVKLQRDCYGMGPFNGALEISITKPAAFPIHGLFKCRREIE